MNLSDHQVFIYKFKEERVLHAVYKAFKTINAKLVVDPQNLLLKVDALTITSKEDAIRLANQSLADDDQGSFTVREVA